MGLAFIIGLLLGGLVIGALARLALPGPDPMSIPATIGLGIAGTFLGGSSAISSSAIGAEACSR